MTIRTVLDVPDGNYLFRECEGRWWRAISIIDGFEHANWIAKGRTDARAEPFVSTGQWYGPVSDSDPMFVKANADTGGRLLEDIDLVPSFITPRQLERALEKGWY